MRHRGTRAGAAVLAAAIAVGTFTPEAGALSTMPQFPTPLVVDASALASCGWPAMPIHAVCAVYDGNGDAALGETTFGFANLARWGVGAASVCVDAGPTAIADQLRSGYPDALGLDGNPRGSVPTYVCHDGGLASVSFSTLLTLVGSVLVVAVNDCQGQVNAAGDPTPCASEPDKFDVVGFDRFRLLGAYRGNDPAAIGEPGGTPGFCGQRPSDPSAACLVLAAVAPTVGVDVLVRGTGRGIVRNHDVRCRRSDRSCRFAVRWGAPLRLVARANARSSFAGWTGACGGTGPCWISVRHHVVVRARFLRLVG